jgi:hypothetical protein
MKSPSKIQIVYIILSVLGLLLTWVQNIHYLSFESGGLVQFVKDTFANPASTSITLDIAVLFIVCALWMIAEGRKLAMKHLWFYIFGGLFIAISVTFPLFLYFREEKLKSITR